MTEDPGNAGKETDECLTRCYLIASVQSCGAQRNASLNNNRQGKHTRGGDLVATNHCDVRWDFNSKKSRRHVDFGLLDACGLLVATTCLLSPTQWKFRFSKSKHV
ncbi:hypothetical protein D8674_001698 [Pyrus ussuriensis x Pyrus communis]|uniref:Uncharacterized protein n=1 Tax=Pyrus ussuriensis x Pyrus communis TaxID=2448454 RepID=A0A5N5F6U4_9ROSA|nr:hypothetical protein D8674_001698 [Pyrus ussuriensis x Pyrus communis]